MKVLAIKGAVLLVLMKENLHYKNIVAILLAYIYNNIQSLSGQVSFEPFTERVSSWLSGEITLATTTYIPPNEVFPHMLQRGVREKICPLLLWAVKAETKRRLSCQ